MSNFAQIKLDTNMLLKGVNRVLKRKQRYIKNDSELYANILIEFQNIIEHRVPKETGNLRNSADIVQDDSGKWSLVYDPENKYGGHYGAAQYFSPRVGNHIWKRHTSGTGGYWDKRLPLSDVKKFITVAKREIINSWNREGKK